MRRLLTVAFLLLVTAGCRSDELPAHEIEVHVLSADTVAVDGVEVKTEDLVYTLGSLQATPETRIVLVADTALPMGYLLDAQERLRAANFTRLSVQTTNNAESGEPLIKAAPDG